MRHFIPGMDPGGAVIYLADHVDEQRLSQSSST